MWDFGFWPVIIKTSLRHIVPFSLIEVDRLFRDAYCLHQGYGPDDGVCISETSIKFFDATRRYIPKGCHLQLLILIILIILSEEVKFWRASLCSLPHTPGTFSWVKIFSSTSCSQMPSICVRFQVLTAASMKFRVIWDVVPCSHVEVDRRFRGAYCLHHRPDDW
jgi:hypothetical protein